MLLSKFGDGTGRDSLVWVWDKTTGSVWRSKVEAVAVQNDLYTLPDELELPDVPNWFPDRYLGPQGLERNLADIEGMLGALIDRTSRTLEVFEPGSVVLDFVLRTLVLLEFRTPSHLEAARQQMELMANLTAQIDRNRRSASSEQDETPRLEVPFKENKHILLGQSLAVSDAIVQHHHGRNWSLWACASERPLVVSDNPVTRCFARPPTKFGDSPAPATANTLYFLPLTRNLLLTGDDRVAPALRYADGRMVGFHNALALYWADRFVFTHRPSFTLLLFDGNPPMYRVLDDPAAFLLEMSPVRFRDFVTRGIIAKPKRWEVGMPEDLRHLVTPGHLADMA